jgi:carboxyl-terminal processing protease
MSRAGISQEDRISMSRWNLAWLLGITAVTLVGLSLCYSAPTRESSLQRRHENLRLLVDVLDEVEHKYVKELGPEKMRDLVEDMINSGLEHLDRHSNFINADEYRQFMKQSKGRFGGIGIKIGTDRGGQVFVESPMVGTPAYEAGILAGDLIVKIDGKSTETMSLKKAVDMIQGEPGQQVVLSVVHEGSKKPVDIPITRAEIHVDSVLGDVRKADKLEEWDFMMDRTNRIAYLRVVQFGETTVTELTAVIDQLQKEGMRGLIIDLRGNPGGLLKAAVETSSLFLPEGKKVVTTKGRDRREEVYESRKERTMPPGGTDYPIVVLVNRWSASASEIVAAALQDHHRAIIIGERSYGKGSVQNVIQLESGTSALKLTTASYWRPSGKNIHRFPDSKEEDEWGVRANEGFEVKLSDEERLEYYKYRRDRDVVRRPGQPVKVPGPKEEKGDKTAKVKEPFRDRVLDKALDYLRGELQKKTNAAGPRQPAVEKARVSREIAHPWAPLPAQSGIVQTAERPVPSTSVLFPRTQRPGCPGRCSSSPGATAA